MAVSEPAPTTETTPEMQTFSIRPELLDAGKQTTVLVGNDILKATVMVADSGGETVVHSHLAMDQIFIVLQGQATFYKSLDEVVAVLGPMEGIMVPRGAVYWYEKTSEENMVLLRAASVNPNGEHNTLRFSGQLQPAIEPKIREGAFFGD